MTRNVRVLVRRLRDNTPMDSAEYRQFVPTVAAGRTLGPPLAVLVLTACAALYGHVPTLWLVLALLLFAIESVVKILTGKHYLALPEAEQRRGRWRRVYWGFAFQSGITFGLASLVLTLPLPQPNWGIVLIAFGGVVLQFSLMSANHLPAAIVSIVPMLIPLPLVLLFSGDALNIALALVMLYIGALTLDLTRRIAGASLQRIHADLENQTLLDRVAREHTVAEEQRRIAEQAVVDKSRFIALASHDLRQPLHALGLYQGTLRRKACSDDTRALFDASDRLIENLNALFDGLLDVSRLDAGVVEPVLEPVSLTALLETVYDEYRLQANAQGIAWHVDDSTDDVVLTDSTLLLRILRNLVTNAFNHTRSGRVAIEIQRDSSETLTLNVSDTGEGIASDQLEVIFDEFQRLDGRSDRRKGFGLGLAIVRRLSALLNIELSVESVQSEGSRFQLRVPLVGAATRDQQAIAGQQDSLHTVRVLVIDDDATVLDAMSQMLADWGCTVFAIRTRAELAPLLDELDDIPPDLVLCDYELGDGDCGIDVYHLLAGRFPEIPLVVITGDSSPETIRALERQELAYLTKPVLPSRLRQIMVTTLSNR